MIKGVTHAHSGPIWYLSEPSDVPYSPNQYFLPFLIVTGSRINVRSFPEKLEFQKLVAKLSQNFSICPCFCNVCNLPILSFLGKWCYLASSLCESHTMHLYPIKLFEAPTPTVCCTHLVPITLNKAHSSISAKSISGGASFVVGLF